MATGFFRKICVLRKSLATITGVHEKDWSIDFQISPKSLNNMPIVISLTNFANVFLSTKGTPLKGYDALFERETPTIRPGPSMRRVDLNASTSKSKSDVILRRRYYKEINRLIARQKTKSGSKNIVIFNVNALPTKPDTVEIYGATSCHPYILGYIVLQYEVTKIALSYRKTSFDEGFSKALADPRNGIHVVQMGIPKRNLVGGKIKTGSKMKDLKPFFFEALAMANLYVGKLNVLQNL